MGSRYTFSQKLASALALVVLVAVAVAVVAVYALRNVVTSKDRVINVVAQRLIDAEQLHALSLGKAAEARDYLMTRDPARPESLRTTRERFRDVLERLRA